MAEDEPAQGLRITCCGGPLEESSFPDSSDGYYPGPDGGFEWYGLSCPRCKMEYAVKGYAPDDEDEEAAA
ncbi:MAG: hypothetical protein HY509_04690 [Acidobacteria bacterium]|nr:hypothetical protein [Acidobacteriota bacterium]